VRPRAATPKTGSNPGDDLAIARRERPSRMSAANIEAADHGVEDIVLCGEVEIIGIDGC
jgi:hypothetical protein